jgi:hypothetical protein
MVSQLNSSVTPDRQEHTCLPGVIAMPRPMEPRSMDSYHTLEETTEMQRRFNRKRSEWTIQQHEEWGTLLYYQCLARDSRYKQESPSECLLNTASNSISLSTVFCVIPVFCDIIFDCAVWSKDYIYGFVCPGCSIRGIALILMGALFCLVQLLANAASPL